MRAVKEVSRSHECQLEQGFNCGDRRQCEECYRVWENVGNFRDGSSSWESNGGVALVGPRAQQPGESFADYQTRMDSQPEWQDYLRRTGESAR